MESYEIVKFFISKGYQLDKKALDYLTANQSDITNIVTKLDSLQRKPLIVTLDHLNQDSSKTKEELKVYVVKKFGNGRKPKNVQEITKFFRDRYQKISSILTNRLELVNLVSVNRINDKMRKFSIIVLVRDRNDEEKSVITEDSTGELKIFFSGEDNQFKQIVNDEVVGVVCENDNGTVFARSMVYPDVQLKKTIPHTEEDVFCYLLPALNSGIYNSVVEKINAVKSQKLLFVLDYESVTILTKLSNDTTTARIFALSKIGQQHNNITFLEDPSTLDINSTRILVSNGSFLKKYAEIAVTDIDVLLGLLRKRHLDPKFEPDKKIYNDDPYFLDTVPDIIAVHGSGKPSALNYKGTTLLSTGDLAVENAIWKVNLRTRENIKVELR